MGSVSWSQRGAVVYCDSDVIFVVRGAALSSHSGRQWGKMARYAGRIYAESLARNVKRELEEGENRAAEVLTNTVPKIFYLLRRHNGKGRTIRDFICAESSPQNVVAPFVCVLKVAECRLSVLSLSLLSLCSFRTFGLSLFLSI